VNKDTCLPIKPANIRDLTREYDLCITGEVKHVYIWKTHLNSETIGTGIRANFQL
jgi:hypothetical protein